MKYISLGIQCHITTALTELNIRNCAYPFDWHFVPSKATYEILEILINKGIDEACEYMTTDYMYYEFIKCEYYTKVDIPTQFQINPKNGLGIVHYSINDDVIQQLKTRLTRLLDDIKIGDNITFIYADCAGPNVNYYIDNIEYGLDANEYLEKIFNLIFFINKNIKIIYFCWPERKLTSNNIIHVVFDYKNHWNDVVPIIKDYLCNEINK